ncbi:uncharacterized protein LOC110665716 isoform X5 [Hevea brasiliensis]|uniref:uncharacterized protein LOC110665716 isoform X5 n=1 Tax=Hevea brasiliensis TaxID=3981 RepID=UPI0025E23652|nr:uncharacterized protein LOC110665716 isoform X5 [Hevea brasiliensis]
MSITAMASCSFPRFRVQCSNSKPKRGFGAKNDPNNNKAPGLSSRFDGKSKSMDIEFEERLEAVKRSALEQRKADEIDYDAPVKSEKKTIGLGTKIGVGVAVLVFGLVFALGDFLPSGSDGPLEDAIVVDKKLSKEEKATLQARLKQYEATLAVSSKDPTALEVLQGAAVTLAELGEYARASSLLQDLAKEKPTDPEVFRLLGEVKYVLKDYEGSANAYRISVMVSKNVNFEVLRGLTNALLAAKKPDEAVQILLASRERLNSEKPSGIGIKADGNAMETESEVDPIQVDLLLGKVYSDWGHVSDAVSVYDQLISSHPNDFRVYLAKGIILKENGNVGDAERMFIQARFFAPEKAKAFVDRYARK